MTHVCGWCLGEVGDLRLPPWSEKCLPCAMGGLGLELAPSLRFGCTPFLLVILRFALRGCVDYLGSCMKIPYAVSVGVACTCGLRWTAAEGIDSINFCDLQ